MEISSKGLYAIRGIVDLAMHSRDKPVPLSNVAVRQDISQHYLEQLFVRLRRAGLVASVRGPGGGYLPAQDLDKITIRDILEAVDESIIPASCAEVGDSCNRIDSCVVRLVMQKLADQIARLLESITLGDLCKEAAALMGETPLDHPYNFSI